MESNVKTGSYVRIDGWFRGVVVNGGAAEGDEVRVTLKNGKIDIATLGAQIGTPNGRPVFKKWKSRRLTMGDTE